MDKKDFVLKLLSDIRQSTAIPCCHITLSTAPCGLLDSKVGIGNFFINREALRRLDFSDVLYNWDCG